LVRQDDNARNFEDLGKTVWWIEGHL
jgi:hypothetical protein